MKKISRIEYCAGFEPLQSGMEQDEGSRILLRAMVPLPQDESSVYARCRHHLCGNQDFRERFSLGTRAQFRWALQLLCDAHRVI